jgi:hypothetical protein
MARGRDLEFQVLESIKLYIYMFNIHMYVYISRGIYIYVQNDAGLGYTTGIPPIPAPHPPPNLS